MNGPHDPSAPANEVVSCRCTLGYDFPDDAVANATTPGRETELLAATATDARVVPAAERLAWGANVWPTLTEAQREAVRSYSHLSFSSVNRVLRDIIPDWLTQEKIDVARGYIAEIDKLMKTSRVPEDVVVVRSTRTVAFGGDPTLMINKVVTDDAYLSTSLNVDKPYAAKAKGRDWATVTITVPRGVPGYYVQNISEIAKPEYELLLDRGTKLVITSAHYSKEARRWLVEARVLLPR